MKSTIRWDCGYEFWRQVFLLLVRLQTFFAIPIRVKIASAAGKPYRRRQVPRLNENALFVDVLLGGAASVITGAPSSHPEKFGFDSETLHAKINPTKAAFPSESPLGGVWKTAQPMYRGRL